MKRFWNNIRKYKNYAVYSAVATMKADVSESYFSWLWWILDPFLFMMVYAFVSIIVFGKSEQYFIPFIFIGRGAWSFFNNCITKSVKLVRSNKGILSRVYLPKYILVISMLIEGFFRYLITVALFIIMAIISGVPYTPYVFWFPVIVAFMVFFIFGFSCLMTHIGVYAQDMSNMVAVVLRLMFYLSGVFFSVDKRVPKPYNKLLLTVNPMALYIDNLRKVALYGQAPDFKRLLLWFAISAIAAILGIYLIQKNEQTYVKAI